MKMLENMKIMKQLDRLAHDERLFKIIPENY